MLKALAFVLACCANCQAEDWPRFRGPDGAGVGKGSSLPVEFGPEKNLAWKTAAPAGHSSPVIVGNRLYLTAADEASLMTLAVDPATGRELWRRSLPRERKGTLNKLNSAATPTPAADSSGVVVFFQDFGLAAYSADGRAMWTLPFPKRANVHGMATSPVISGKTVIQVVSGNSGSLVAAVGRHNGETIWQQELEGVTFSTPVVINRTGAPPLAMVASTGEGIAFNTADGKREWWTRAIPYGPCGSPYVSPDGRTVYVSVPSVEEVSRKKYSNFDELLKMWDVNGDGKLTAAELTERGGPAGAFGQIDTNEDGVYDRPEHEDLWKLGDLPHLMGAVSTAGRGDVTGKVNWSTARYVPTVSTPIVYEGVFYAIRNGGIVASMDASTGELKKEGRIAPDFGAVYSSPVAADGKIYAAGLSGKVAVLKAGAQWEVLTVNDLGEECSATPALVDDRIYFRTGGHLWCFRQKRD